MAEKGTYTFRWEHPAEEVFVTGTFDDWGKSVKLEQNAAGVFEKQVELPLSAEPVFYKFVTDGEWVTSHTAPTETDSNGNTNNVLRPADIVTSSAAPESSTAAMAASVPTEPERKASTIAKDAPGAFPETPGMEKGDFGVNPIPQSDGPGNPVDLQPGEKVPDPSTINENTLTSGVHDDPELVAADQAKSDEGEQTFGVAPIPATSGTGNPIDLKPGEPVPPASKVTTNTVNSTVKTDKESYERSDAMPGDSNPVVTTGPQSSEAPPVSGEGTKIPESGGIPIGKDAPTAQEAAAESTGPTIQSAGPQSTTAALAAQVPLEKDKKAESGDPTMQSAAPAATTAGLAAAQPVVSKDGAVPDVVTESQKEAQQDPEAAANPEAVEEKKAVEKELLEEVKPGDEAGEPAPTEAAASSAEAPKADSSVAAPDAAKGVDSRDVSPTSKPAAQDGAASAAAAPAAAAAAAPSTPTSKKEKKDEGGGGSVGRRRMSGMFGGKKDKTAATPESSAKKTPEKSKAAATAATNNGSTAASPTPTPTPGSDNKDDKKGKRKSLFGKIKEAFK